MTVNGSAGYSHMLIIFFEYEKMMLKEEETLNLGGFIHGREEQSYGRGRNDKIIFEIFEKLKVIE